MWKNCVILILKTFIIFTEPFEEIDFLVEDLLQNGQFIDTGEIQPD